MGVLATDLDGTLIPLAGELHNRADLQALGAELAANAISLVFVTGRHLELAARAIEDECLPPPDWLIADVGTSVYMRTGDQFVPLADYQEHLGAIVAALPRAALEAELAGIAGLRLQELQKQGPFKLSYYADAGALDAITGHLHDHLEAANAPWSVISSVDPFTGDGLIDLLPAGVSKAYALSWWVEHTAGEAKQVVFAGDSGNDLAALTAGYQTIVVGNADRGLAAQVHRAHRARGWHDRLYLARRTATSGVLDGCRWFGLLPAVPGPAPHLLGATPVVGQRTHFRVWAPRADTVAVHVLDGTASGRHALEPEGEGYFAATVSGVTAGHRYSYRVDGGPARPDPASRRQPEGVHGPSQVVDPDSFPWTDDGWTGVAKRDLVIYELHVGAFTAGGTFATAVDRLDELVELGITAVELMPVTQSPGRWNWGYDGVDLYAVRDTYGEPDDLKALVDACHTRGLGVILDVVYNHIGPEGNYLAEFGPYVSARHRTGWGDAFNYDEPGAEHVRRFILDNARYWLEEYHVDGLRLDAVYFTFDDSSPGILDELAQSVAAHARTAVRPVHLIGETNHYDHGLLASNEYRAAYDAIWCDCLMHAIYSIARPELPPPGREYHGGADVARALRRGWVYHGQSATRGGDDEPQAVIGSLVVALQNHDRVGSHPRGARVHQLTSIGFQKAAAALVLLYPAVPLVFMGEEIATETPFPFFVDFGDEGLRDAVRRGRASEIQVEGVDHLTATEPQTFFAARRHPEDRGDASVRAWYGALLALRKRGLATGWLSASHMTVDHDAERHLFTVRFKSAAGDDGIVVRARLSAPDDARAEPVPLDGAGELLLSSEPGRPTMLGANHAVVHRLGSGTAVL